MSNRPRSRSTSDLWRNRRAYQMEESVQDIRGQMLGSLVFQETPDTSKEVLDAFLANLPKLTENELAAIGQADAPCPICLNPFSIILTEEEMALAMDTPAHPIEDLGVTRPGTCGHVFCMKDIRNWVSQGKNTCPSCRSTFPNLPTLPTHSSTHDALVTALQQQMQALNYSGDRTPPQTVVPLTAEQMASLHETIMLFQSGGAYDEAFGQLEPVTTEQRDALLARMRDDGVAPGSREGDGEHREEDDRESYSSMYS